MTTRAQAVAFEQSAATAELSSRCLLAALAYVGVPASMLDIGCGPGHLVTLAANLGTKRALGVDFYVRTESWDAGPVEIPRRGLLQHDLRLPLPIEEPHELVLCLEVAEHLPPESASGLCDGICRMTEPGGVALFSAATPGQGGSGHLNERPESYWRLLLGEGGLSVDEEMTERLRRVWSEVAPGAWWYGKNVIVLRRPR